MGTSKSVTAARRRELVAKVVRPGTRSSKSLAVIVRWHWLACLEASSRRRLRGGKDAVRKEETGDGGPFDMANPAAVSRRFTLTTWANRGQKLELQGERRPIHAEVVAERADFGRGARELCKL